MNTLLRLALIIPLTGLAISCGPADVPNEDAAMEAMDMSIAMGIINPEPRQIVRPIYGTGTIAAAQTSDIGPSVSGIIEEIYVRVGARVDEGETLFRTEIENYELAVTVAQAALELASARADLAQSELERATTLTARGVTSEARLEERQSQLRVANAERASAAAALQQANKNLEDTTIGAPFRGVVTARYVDEGVYMSTRIGGGLGGGSAVVRLQQIDVVAAIVQVPEIYLSQLRVGMPGRLYIDGLDQEFESEIHILNDRIDPLTRTVEIRLGIANEDYVVRPGLFVRAEVFPDARSALLLPRRAVAGPSNAPYVYLLSDGVARRRSVTLREHDAEFIEVLSGLDPDDPVLIGPNLPRLRDGSAVQVEG